MIDRIMVSNPLDYTRRSKAIPPNDQGKLKDVELSVQVMDEGDDSVCA